MKFIKKDDYTVELDEEKAKPRYNYEKLEDELSTIISALANFNAEIVRLLDRKSIIEDGMQLIVK